LPFDIGLIWQYAAKIAALLYETQDPIKSLNGVLGVIMAGLISFLLTGLFCPKSGRQMTCMPTINKNK
jgi:hypothetical protein